MEHVEVPGMAAEEILTEMVNRYSNPLLRTCYVYLQDDATAQDIVQEVFLRAWRHMNQLRLMEERAQKAWLVRTAINLCHDHHRSRWFRYTDRWDSVEDMSSLPAEQGPEANLLLMDVIRLPEKYKQMILLYYYQEMTIREAAQALGISHTAAQRRLKKAVALLGMDFTGRDEM